jgi:hexosaminidase
LSALAEVLWTPRERRDFGDFSKRLSAHLARLDALDVNYRR